MEITEVRINRRTEEDAKLKGYAAVTFDDIFVVRDLKIIDGKNGLFVAMPSQKIQDPCSHCRKKNPVHSKFCNECGKKLPFVNQEGKRRQLHRDIAHPVTSEMRNYLQTVIIEAYHAHEENPEKSSERSSEKSSQKKEAKTPKETTPESKGLSLSTEDYLSTPSLSEEERVPAESDVGQGLLDTVDS